MMTCPNSFVKTATTEDVGSDPTSRVSDSFAINGRPYRAASLHLQSHRVKDSRGVVTPGVSLDHSLSRAGA